jgi:hypothetical protein
MLAFDVCNEGWRSKAMLDTVFEVARISTVDVAGSDRYCYYYAVSKRLAAGILLDYCIAGG